MRNASGSFWCSRVAVLQQVLGPQAAPHGLALHHLGAAMEADDVVMPPLLFRALASLNLILLLGYLLLVLLANLFARLHLRAAAAAKDGTRLPRARRLHCSDCTTTTPQISDTFRVRMCRPHIPGSLYGHAEAGIIRMAATTTVEPEATGEEDVAAADTVQGQPQADVLFWFDKAVFEDSTLLLGDEGKDHHLYAAPAPARCLPVESTFPMEESAPRIVPPRNQNHRVDAVQQVQDEAANAIAVHVVPEQGNIPVVASPENVSIEGKKESSSREEDSRRDDTDGGGGRAELEREEKEDNQQEVKKSLFPEGHKGQHDVKLFVNSQAVADTRKLLLEGVVAAGGGAQLRQDADKDKNGDSSRFGASTLTSESTSKSSVEWRSSTVTKDSETEYPFSSSSRRSSARWESYTLFRKYDEDMVYFHRVGAQKLTETESFRSIKYQPRSMSERIVQKLTPKPSAPIGLRDPYPDLERAYVAQVCLTWEALSWNHSSFRRHNGGDGNMAARCCPARVAQEFQQFQVLLHRFVENEPYEYGRRPEVYARMKNSTPKLLLVPELRDEDNEKVDDLISAVQFLVILEESIRTFMAFLRADKRSHYEMFREMVKRRRSSSGVDQTLVITLKRSNKRKKRRLKDLTRPRRCLKRTKVREEEELSILLGLIDLKVVARVLRMPEITDQQLHWCEEKMNRVRVDVVEGKMERDPSPLFYPAH